MIDKEIRAGFYVCASICGQDGIISETEELALVQKFTATFNLNESEIEQLFENFFSSDENFDEYLNKVVDADLRLLIYKIAKYSAAADELEVRENIALERSRLTWGFDLCQ
jgi:hypothetical protein|tara:strand:- start:1067 stop:1399 length:333 start_codon:yes stop_codon:yes gene_type:complete